MRKLFFVLIVLAVTFSANAQGSVRESLYVLYPPNSANLGAVGTEQAIANMEVFTEVARYLINNPQARLLIDGHANAAVARTARERQRLVSLSRQRAEAAANFIAANYGISRQRLIISSAGGSIPFSTTDGSLNRRVSFIVIITTLPVSTAALPARGFTEIASRTIEIGEQISLSDLVTDRNVVSWTSSTPQAVSVDAHGTITGVNLGNAFIRINDSEYISIAVVPADDFFVVPDSLVALLPRGSNSSSATDNIAEYRTEPTFRLAFRWNNRGEYRGASGTNGGIDILGRGSDYEWLWTTYYQGGWFYDLNGVIRVMENGFQRSANGVELRIIPEFVYDKGVPYLQLRHLLTNTSNNPVEGQRFGASADVMIHDNDLAALILTPYGAYMTDSQDNPSLELMFVCLSGEGITPVDTLWLGTYRGGEHLDYIYEDSRTDIHNEDSAIAFSYQDIDLNPGETKEFIVRFTLARNEE